MNILRQNLPNLNKSTAFGKGCFCCTSQNTPAQNPPSYALLQAENQELREQVGELKLITDLYYRATAKLLNSKKPSGSKLDCCC